MASDEAPVPAIGNRPSWWKVGVASLAGVVSGYFVVYVLQWPLTLLLDQLFGRSEWQESLDGWPQLLRLALLTLYLTIPFALGQFFATLMSGWAGTVYTAAALQTLHLVNIYGGFALSILWLLPAVIAVAMTLAKWAASGAEKGRARQARLAAARDKC